MLANIKSLIYVNNFIHLSSSLAKLSILVFNKDTYHISENGTIEMKTPSEKQNPGHHDSVRG